MVFRENIKLVYLILCIINDQRKYPELPGVLKMFVYQKVTIIFVISRGFCKTCSVTIV